MTHLVNGGLDAVVRRLNAKHPGISYNVEVSSSYGIVRAVSQQLTPFGICLLAKPLPTLSCQFLFRERFGVFCGRGHRLFGVEAIDFDAIRNEPWVSFACAEVSNSLEPMLTLRLGADIARRVVATSPDLFESGASSPPASASARCRWKRRRGMWRKAHCGPSPSPASMRWARTSISCPIRRSATAPRSRPSWRKCRRSRMRTPT